ncbi:hypothetical protein [Myroides sp. N17-2]|uniref:hypothetical protein n=1 Tax=Myroides sp. N17-2 TaxID=2030799 RepID=UPI000EFD05FB|nr:hypothetical protein [Myroides sp. N17-2]
MRNSIFYLIIILLPFLGYSQVGIGTVLPQHLVHIDAKGNNPVDKLPSIEEGKDDFVVTKEGNVGIGVVNPTSKLEINGTIRIKDGAEGIGKILVSDKNGVGKWEKVAYDIPTLVGQLEGNALVTSSSGAANQSHIFSYYYVQLTKGRWVVNSGINLKMNTSKWIHSVLSTLKTGKEQNGFKFTTLANTGTANAARLKVGNGMLMGSSVIEVTAENITLYLLIEKSGSWSFDPEAAQNYFYASPIL